MKKSQPLPVVPLAIRYADITIRKIQKGYGASTEISSRYIGLEEGITSPQNAQLPHLDWVPADIVAFCSYYNGMTLLWQADKQNAPLLRGRVMFKPLQIMLGDWEGEMYFRSDLTPENAHMEHFKVVDACTDEAVVGLFHTEARDPELHYYDLEDTTPLRVDFAGYLGLLTHTLGCHGWHALLLELDAPTPETRPFLPTGAAAQEALRKLQAAVPDFNLDAFVAQYDQVRLPG